MRQQPHLPFRGKINIQRKIVQKTLLIIPAMILSTCSQRTSKKAFTPITVQLPFSHTAEFAGFCAAEQQGYYAEDGLQISFVEG